MDTPHRPPARDPRTPEQKAEAARKVSRALLVAGALGVLAPLLFAGVLDFACSRVSGYDAVVMKALDDCPVAREALGQPIQASLLGWSCGSMESGGGHGYANWTRPVTGPKGRGSYQFHVEERGGQWSLLSGTLEVGDRTIDVAQCLLVARGAAVDRERVVRGTVASVTGAAPAPAGASCTVTIGPGGGPYGCRLEIGCGGRVLYGHVKEAGYLECHVVAGPGGQPTIAARDADFSARGGDPAVDFREAKGELILSDQVDTGMWVITIRLDGAPGPADEPPPATSDIPPA